MHYEDFWGLKKAPFDNVPVALLSNAAGMVTPLIAAEGMLGVLAGGTLLLLVGIRDDIREVLAVAKLVVQVVAAGIVIWPAGS